MFITHLVSEHPKALDRAYGNLSWVLERMRQGVSFQQFAVYNEQEEHREMTLMFLSASHLQQFITK